MIRHCIGIDLGTSGVRAEVLGPDGAIVAGLRRAWPEAGRVPADAAAWWHGVRALLRDLAGRMPAEPVAVAVDGTSATLLATDGDGEALGPALMYDDARAVEQARLLAGVAPRDAGVHGPAASAAKLLWLRDDDRLRKAVHVLHQAEWITGRLLGRFDRGDENNALKLGYDPVAGAWPCWWRDLLGPLADLLPEVVPAGTPLGPLAGSAATETGLHPDSLVVAGTTDGVAGFLATGVDRPGIGVTSLGSTLVLKQLCERPLFDPDAGVYSHRVLGHWLTGGASNSGGAVLAAHFGPEEIRGLCAGIDAEQGSGLDYYPLNRPGERFPVSDARLAPRLTPRPESDMRFLHGLLEGIARIEAAGYARLQALGAPALEAVASVGGGAANPQWTAIRERVLGVPVHRAAHEQAAHGAALLARHGTVAAGV
ncbi:FGGY-family carbohydrate kinase [Thioalkalivibrio sp.]|uniref:FGGY-family carbohydrate kinase n=1 Tax=Thioalkalivibrio sp. TaxID=2093813 RepID=UPI003562421C